MPEGLKIQVGADVRQAVKALSQEIPAAADKAVGSFTNLQNQSTGLTGVFGRQIPAAMGKTAVAVKALDKPISHLGDTLETLKAKVGARQSFLNIEKDPAKVAILNREIAALNTEIVRVGNIGSKGFDALGNSISNVPPKLQGVATGAGKAFSILRQAAFILPGIGIAGLIGGLTELVGGLFNVGASFSQVDLLASQFTGTMRRLKQEVDSFKQGLDFSESIRNINAELSGLTGVGLLTAKGANKILSDSQFIGKLNESIDSLVNRNKALVDNRVKLEKALSTVAGVNTPLNRLLTSLKPGTAIEDISGNLLKELSKSDQQLVKEFTDTNKEIRSLQEKRQKATFDIFIEGAKIPLSILNQSKEDEKKIQDSLKTLRDKSLADYEKYVSDTISEAGKLSNAFKNIIDLKLETNFFDGRQQQFEKSLKFLTDFKARRFSITIDPELKLNEEQFKAQNDLIEKAIKEGIEIIDKGFSTRIEVDLLPTVFDKVDKSKLQKQLDEIGKELNLKIPVTLDLSAPQKGIQNDIKAAFDRTAEAQKLGKDTAAAFNSGIKQISTEGLASIGESIGIALSGGDISSAFKAFAASLGGALEAMGKQIIGIGVAALLAKEALTKLFANPAIAIAAGVALVAAGAALKSALSGGVKGFAQGGLVYGPTLGLIGEGAGTNRNNPEVIAPLKDLIPMLAGMGGGGGVVIINRRVRGRDQVLQASREQRSQRRTTGRG